VVLAPMVREIPSRFPAVPLPSGALVRFVFRSSVQVLILALVAAGLVVIPGAAPAHAQALAYDATVDLTYPVAGPTSFINDYAACRGTNCARRHKATDVMAPYGARVHAAMGGTITFITGQDGPPPAYGYMITIAGDDGRKYSYIHLGRQDGTAGEAYAPGMHRGLRVERGQHIGINGCSGNASCNAPHLHFEIEDARVVDPYGTSRMNPYGSLLAAKGRGDIAENVSPVGGCQAFSGDWMGTGQDSPGWWCSGRTRLLLPNGAIEQFNYGRAGDVPVIADWNGDGRDTVSVIRDGTWHLNDALRGGASSRQFTYGRVTRGDVPIAGAWDRPGASMPGIIRDRDWHLRSTQSGGAGDHVFTYGRLTGGDLPLVGDWNGDGRSRVGIVRGGTWYLRDSLAGGAADLSYVYGRVVAGDQPVVGDWNGDGRSTPGIVRAGQWHLRHSHSGGAADEIITFLAP
jgi:hypothetical protein